MLNREGVFWFANDQTVRDEKFSIARYLRCGNHNPADIFVTRFDYSTVEGSTGCQGALKTSHYGRVQNQPL